MTSHAKLTLIRHGSTAMNNSADEIRGWRDIPLAPEGIVESEKEAERLKAKNLDGIVTSDLQRAEQTAHIVSTIIGAPILSQEYGLRPWNLGIYTGRKAKDVIHEMEYYTQHPDEPVMWGESFNTFRHRFLSTIALLDREYAGKRIGIVTHHRGDRLLAAWEAAGYPADFSIDMNVFLKHGIEPGTSRDIPLGEIKRVDVLKP